MTCVVWLGPLDDARRLESVLAQLQISLASATDVETTLKLAVRRSAAAIIVAVDWGILAETVVQLTTANPEIQILVATRLGVPPQVSAAFDAGARDLLDIKECDPAQIGAAIDRALARHKQTRKERDLLIKLHTLNEDFLKAMVVLDKRNNELEQIVQGSSIDDRPIHVLVIDDEGTIASLIEYVLTNHGYKVTVALDGETGLKHFQKNQFPIVITDKNLPGIDGVAVMREIKRVHPETDVILITGYGSKESAIAALNIGATAYIEKPFNDIHDIRRKVDEVAAAQKMRNKKRDLLRTVKQRNRDFLKQYRDIRQELQSWLNSR
ncbi:MAG: response regulator [Deltaproteobacteria bacterium]|nr:response regulator [Deltaproteobacteria bacterium]